MKLHLYNEEMATVAASLLLHRPLRFVADRLESFVSDIDARAPWWWKAIRLFV